MKTTKSLKASEMERAFWLVDAKDMVLGRMASQIALRLRGKHKPTYTPHMDCGDAVIVINAECIKLTGKKRDQKTFYWHTGYPGGIKGRTQGQILDGAHPERCVQKAVQRMLGKGPLGRQQLRQLKVYKGASHPHAAQNPKIWDIAKQNTKNKREAVAA